MSYSIQRSRSFTEVLSGRVSILITLALIRGTVAYQMIPRWGHASTFIPSPPALVIHGGKTDPSGAGSYTSSANSNDLLILPLSTSWDSSSPPWTQASSLPSPSCAWHTLAGLGDDGADILLFGGDGGSSTPTPTGMDSAWLLSLDIPSVTSNWTQEPSGWEEEPMRRMYHFATGDGHAIFITGGEKADGSGQIFSDVYQVTSSGFTALPPLPVPLCHHISVLTDNGTLIVMGGAFLSPQTGNAAVSPMSTVYSLDTTSSVSSWRTSIISGTLPDGRRGATGVWMENDQVFLFGGADAGLVDVYGDAWILDVFLLTWTQASVSGIPAPRYDHSAIMTPNGQIVLFGGYGTSGPVDANTYIYDSIGKAWTTSWSTSSSLPTSQGNSATNTPPQPTVNAPTTSFSSVTMTDSEGHTVVTASPVTTTTPSVTATPSSTESGRLSVPAQIGVAIGIAAAAATSAILIVFLCRHRSKKRSLIAAKSWDAERRGMIESKGLSKPNAFVEKDQAVPGHFDESPTTPPVKSKPKPRLSGLGMGTIGANFSKITQRAFSVPQAEHYTPLQDESDERGDLPNRQKTRREGQGIRLVGPRVMPDLPTSPRVNMLAEEDSRIFDASNGASLNRRGSTGSDLDEDHHPFDDGQYVVVPPSVPGGPVPTPQISRAEVDPTELRQTETNGPNLPPSNDLGVDETGQYRIPSFNLTDAAEPSALLSLPDRSFGRSYRSSVVSTYESSESEGVIHQAHHAAVLPASIVSPSTDLSLSPSSTTYQPVKRTESFFRRMTAGGISGLLSGSTSSKRSSSRMSMEIRDPAPLPTLWPIQSRDEMAAISPAESFTESPRQSDWENDLKPPRGLWQVHGKGVLVSSLISARSMRDMVIVQRETPNTETEAVIEQATGSSLASSSGSESNIGEDSVLDEANISPQAAVQPVPLAPRKLRSISHLQLDSPSIASSPQSAPSTRSEPPIPPSGSPISAAIVSHRRPVKDMVKSINKRSSRVFDSVTLDALSPLSQYSPSSSPPSSALGMEDKRPRTMYEAVRKSPLTVANPDEGKRSNNS